VRNGRLRIVILGLSLSSSWGNGHATTYRALLKALGAQGHDILFLERDVPWYANNRDLRHAEYCRLELYDSLAALQRWHADIATADAVILGSYVPDGIAIGRLVQRIARGTMVFYDIDTPVTLAALARGDCAYLAADLIPGYDLYLSFTGGPTLAHLERNLGARLARPLYCSVDAAEYRPLGVPQRWDLSYLGTYGADRQDTLERLLLEPARRAPELRFVVAGAQYPRGIDWPPNVERMDHIPPGRHPEFYCASRYTLNITRAEMRRAGHSPSVRLFEAAACETPIISDDWPGLATLFTPGEEIVLADAPDQVLAILRDQPEAARRRLAAAGRRRTLAAHTASHRAAELLAHLREAAPAPQRQPAPAAT